MFNKNQVVAVVDQRVEPLPRIGRIAVVVTEDPVVPEGLACILLVGRHAHVVGRNLRMHVKGRGHLLQLIVTAVDHVFDILRILEEGARIEFRIVLLVEETAPCQEYRAEERCKYLFHRVQIAED